MVTHVERANDKFGIEAAANSMLLKVDLRQSFDAL
jgi:hypothetical protein